MMEAFLTKPIFTKEEMDAAENFIPKILQIFCPVLPGRKEIKM